MAIVLVLIRGSSVYLAGMVPFKHNYRVGLNFLSSCLSHTPISTSRGVPEASEAIPHPPMELGQHLFTHVLHLIASNPRPEVLRQSFLSCPHWLHSVVSSSHPLELFPCLPYSQQGCCIVVSPHTGNLAQL